MTRRQALFTGSLHRQRGAALLMLLTIVVLAATYALLRQLNREQPDILRAAGNAEVLAEAKAALVGYALKSTRRPGELPCPDTSNDGISNVGAGCTAYIGRLPWQMLGLGDLRDADGERLWYALDRAFDGTAVINSETVAGLFLDGGAGRYVAFVFSPGESLPGQSRPPAAQNSVARYLEDDNADGDPNFVTTSTNPFNDQLIAISESELLRSVELRVVAELQKILINAPALPPPAAYGSAVCDPTPLTQGLLPVTPDATCPSLPTWPDWFYDPVSNTGWQRLVWYAMDPSKPFTVQDGVNNTLNKEALLIGVGPAMAGQNRNPPPPPRGSLLEGLNAINDINFEIQPIGASFNDQLLIVK